ncbi:MAG TPA: hypothetical protein VFQ90_17815 [Stellaceae bacterium]|jgi:hypothetical protein|nr:hypothetical protein [Stellaceae bacterium]
MNLVRAVAGAGCLGVAVLCGCTQGPSAYESKVAEIVAHHQEAMARVAREAEREREGARAEARRRPSEDRLIARMREPLARFLAERSPSCGSRHLADAASSAPSMIEQMRRNGRPIDTAFMQRVGATMVDIGNAAQRAGCPAEARLIYDNVVRVFDGPRYADLRLRAQFASAYIVRNAQKWMPAPTQAASATGETRAMEP